MLKENIQGKVTCTTETFREYDHQRPVRGPSRTVPCGKVSHIRLMEKSFSVSRTDKEHLLSNASKCVRKFICQPILVSFPCTGLHIEGELRKSCRDLGGLEFLGEIWGGVHGETGGLSQRDASSLPL